jgi:outer membrane receptor protein involved in Fe transport
VELETNFAVTDNLFLVASYGYQHGEFEKGTDSFLESTTGDGDLKGKEVPGAPEQSLILGAVVTKPMGAALDATFRVDYVYESDQWVQAANFTKLGDRKLANLRLSVGSENWTLTGYLNNLLDDDTPWAALNFVDFGRTVGGNQGELWSLSPQRGRNAGLEFQYRFNGL